MSDEKKSRRASQLLPEKKSISSKLKRAEDGDGESTESRRRDEEKEDVAGKKQRRSNKKRRLQEQEEEQEGDGRGGDGGIAVTGEKEEEEGRKKKKKRVSFLTSGSGSGSVSADVKALPVVEKGETEGDEADDEGAASDKKEKRKKKKEKGKKKAGTPNAMNDDSTAGPTKSHSDESPILSYLDLYHNNRSAWKFQKIRETQLFKHVLSLEKVPSQYDDALLSYLRGLKGEAAKQRLRDVAGAAVKTDVEETRPDSNIDTTEGSTEDAAATSLADYRKAVYAFRTKLAEGELADDLGEAFEQLDAELKERFRKRRRAEIVLFAVDGRVFTMSKLKAPPQKGKNATQNQPVKKKKKNRTAFVDISSSSESESESEQKQPAPKPALKKKKKKSRTAIVEISSSSSSESESESSSDSDSKQKKKRSSSSDSDSDSSSSSSSS